jgi:hypothetical protein
MPFVSERVQQQAALFLSSISVPETTTAAIL